MKRTGTDDCVGVTNSRNEGVYNSIAHTRIIMSQRIAVCALSIPKILDLLNDDESDNYSFLPPVKPKGGEIILYRARSESEKGKQPSKVEPGFTLLCMLVLTVYCTFILCLDDWRSDQYRWVNQGVHLLPKKNPVIRKTYYQIQTPEGPGKDFTKHAYQLLSPTKGNVTLIHYIGNEKVAVPFPHGNEKNNCDCPYTRTCSSVLQDIKASSSLNTPSKVYKAAVTNLPASSSHLPVLQPRNHKQVENYRRKHLQNQRISHDSLYSLHQIAYGEPDFIHSIHTFPDFVCVLGQQAILDELDRVLMIQTSSPQLLSYDTTFQLGDFYISVLNFKHTIFREAPVIPAIFMLHERKYQQCHEDFFKYCLKLIPSLKHCRHPIVTNEERGIVNAISNCLPNIICIVGTMFFKILKCGYGSMVPRVMTLLYIKMMFRKCSMHHLWL